MDIRKIFLNYFEKNDHLILHAKEGESFRHFNQGIPVYSKFSKFSSPTNNKHDNLTVPSSEPVADLRKSSKDKWSKKPRKRGTLLRLRSYLTPGGLCDIL